MLCYMAQSSACYTYFCSVSQLFHNYIIFSNIIIFVNILQTSSMHLQRFCIDFFLEVSMKICIFAGAIKKSQNHEVRKGKDSYA